jgi:transcriptional regulator with XRE-family HTH domain
MSIISENIKYLRRLNGLTQEQFSRRIGVKRPVVGSYEEARANPPIELLKHIAKLFGYTVDELVKTDIRRLRRTPDLDLNFEDKKEEPVADPTPIGEILKDFMQKEPPKPETTNQHVQSIVPKPLDFQPAPPQPKPQIVGGIPYVRRSQFTDYLSKFKDENYIRSLPTCHFPNLPNSILRGFEAGADFAFEGALLIGELKRSWMEIEDGKNYILVTKTNGIVYRRVYNQGQIKGTLLLSADNHRFPSTEISVNEVLEAYQMKAFYSTKLPEPSVSFEKMKNLVDELKFEMNRITQ